MFKFAHFSDIHLGAFANDILKQLSLTTFSNSIDLCIERKVNFVIISGDLFDSNVPDMSIVKEAVRKINEARGYGIQFYLVYGSHDYSITQTSIIDILEQTGLFHKVSKGYIEDDELVVIPVVDSYTGVTIVGLNGRKVGLEKSFYELLNRAKLEKINGFKIFVFHGIFSEFKSDISYEDFSIPISLVPKNFNYYAGGHQHVKSSGNLHGYSNVTYPGTLFGSTNKDIEQNAAGQERGFFLVTFSEKIYNIEFVKVESCSYKLKEYNAEDKNPIIVNEELKTISLELEVKNKIVVIKIKGQLSAGKISDIKFLDFKKILEERGALYVWLNYNLLSSKELDYKINVNNESPQEIERRLFLEYISIIEVTKKNLLSNDGVNTANELLHSLRCAKHQNEQERTYKSKIINSGIDILNLNEELKD